MAIDRGYCITGDVQLILYFRNFLENDLQSVRPNVADVEEFIDTSIDDINMTLRTVGYTLPVVLADSPYGYQYIVRWNALGAALELERRYGQQDTIDRLAGEYNGIRDSILNRTVILTDVSGAPTQANLVESGTSELTASGDVKEPFFTRDQDW